MVYGPALHGLKDNNTCTAVHQCSLCHSISISCQRPECLLKQIVTSISLCRDPSLHFCGVTTHRSPLTHNLPPHGQWGKPFLTSSPHTLPHHHPLEKHGQPGRVQGRVQRTKEKGRLKRQASSTVRDSCPMELVATHSFVRVYGREGVSDVIQFLVSQSIM